MSAHIPGGILCAAVTPFDGKGSVDEPALKQLLDYYRTSGLQGVFGLGTASESMLLEPAERRRVAELVVEALDRDFPLLLHCGTPDTRSTVELAQHARSIGVGSVAVIAPYYFAYGRRELVAHYRTIAEAVGDVEVFLYDNPARVGYSVGVDTVAQLTEEVPNIVGVKDTGDSIGRIMRYLALPTPPHVYSGNNELVHATLAIGADGAVSALASGVPELMAAIHTAWKDGDVGETKRLQLLVVRLMGAIRDLPYLGAIKWIGRRRGLPTGETRRPQRGLDDDAARELDRRLAAIEGLAPWIVPV